MNMPHTTTNNNFRFINSYSSNGIKTSKYTRRDVRSYVARVSHNAAAQGRTCRLKGDKHRSTVVFDVEIASLQDDADGSPVSIAVPCRKKHSPLISLPISSSDSASFKPTHLLTTTAQPLATQANTQQCKHPKRPAHPRRTSPIHALSTHNLTPVSALPTYHLPFIPAILHNYVTKLALPIPELDNNSTQPVLRTVWLPIVMQNPAIFQVIILFAAAHYAVYSEPSQFHHFYPEVLALKQTALKGLTQGLQRVTARKTLSEHGARVCTKGVVEGGLPRISPGNGSSCLGTNEQELQEQQQTQLPNTEPAIRPPTSSCTSARTELRLDNTEEDCLIAAIAEMASYEAIFGDKSSYETHMSAVTHLVSLRPFGLASLGSSMGTGGLFARLLRFVDTNSAFLLGTRLYLADQEGVGACLPRHVPFRMRRFCEVESEGGMGAAADSGVGGKGEAGEVVMEKMARMEIGGGRVVNVQRFVGS